MSAQGNPAVLPAGNRVVMVSGASRGIGRAVARRLHDDGYRLSLGARDAGALDEAVRGLDPARVMTWRYEARDAEAAPSWVAATVERFGALDGLVNNAGVLRVINFESGEESALDEMWEVNAKGPFRMIRAALPHLRKCGHGRIVNIASTDSKRYRDYTVSVGYAMSKHALLALNHAARFAGWDDGVRVTALCPGAVHTDLVKGVPGVVPNNQRMDPATIAQLVAVALSMPNAASLSEMWVNARLESSI